MTVQSRRGSRMISDWEVKMVVVVVCVWRGEVGGEGGKRGRGSI